MKKSIIKYKKRETDIELSLKEAQKYLLTLLSALVRFFNDNNIDFFLLWGTLLGAKRNKKIIPWDDDIDIGMTRENYSKLLGVLDKLDDYGIQYLHYCKNSKMYTNEIRVYFDGYYKIQESNFCKYLTPLCIDIFVAEKIDKSLSNEEKLEIEKKLKKTINFLIQKEAIWKSKNYFKYFIRLVRKFFYSFLSTKKLHKKLERLCLELHEKGNEYNLCFPETLHNKNTSLKIYDKKMFENTNPFIFEDIRVRIPSLSDELLTLNYGDWKTPKDRSGGSIYKEKFIFRK